MLRRTLALLPVVAVFLSANKMHSAYQQDEHRTIHESISSEQSPWISGPSNQKYQFHIGKQSWLAAREKCLAQNADLATISSLEELHWLLSHYKPQFRYLRERQVQIGLLLESPEGDSSKEREWRWVNGGPLNVSLMRWTQGEPFDHAKGKERCAVLNINEVRIDDIDCDLNAGPDFNYRFVCQRSHEKHVEHESLNNPLWKKLEDILSFFGISSSEEEKGKSGANLTNGLDEEGYWDRVLAENGTLGKAANETSKLGEGDRREDGETAKKSGGKEEIKAEKEKPKKEETGQRQEKKEDAGAAEKTSNKLELIPNAVAVQKIQAGAHPIRAEIIEGDKEDRLERAKSIVLLNRADNFVAASTDNNETLVGEKRERQPVGQPERKEQQPKEAKEQETVREEKANKQLAGKEERPKEVAREKQPLKEDKKTELKKEVVREEAKKEVIKEEKTNAEKATIGEEKKAEKETTKEEKKTEVKKETAKEEKAEVKKEAIKEEKKSEGKKEAIKEEKTNAKKETNGEEKKTEVVTDTQVRKEPKVSLAKEIAERNARIIAAEEKRQLGAGLEIVSAQKALAGDEDPAVKLLSAEELAAGNNETERVASSNVNAENGALRAKAQLAVKESNSEEAKSGLREKEEKHQKPNKTEDPLAVVADTLERSLMGREANKSEDGDKASRSEKEGGGAARNRIRHLERIISAVQQMMGMGGDEHGQNNNAAEAKGDERSKDREEERPKIGDGKADEVKVELVPSKSSETARKNAKDERNAYDTMLAMEADFEEAEKEARTHPGVNSGDLVRNIIFPEPAAMPIDGSCEEGEKDEESSNNETQLGKDGRKGNDGDGGEGAQRIRVELEPLNSSSRGEGGERKSGSKEESASNEGSRRMEKYGPKALKKEGLETERLQTHQAAAKIRDGDEIPPENEAPGNKSIREDANDRKVIRENTTDAKKATVVESTPAEEWTLQLNKTVVLNDSGETTAAEEAQNAGNNPHSSAAPNNVSSVSAPSVFPQLNFELIRNGIPPEAEKRQNEEKARVDSVYKLFNTKESVYDLIRRIQQAEAKRLAVKQSIPPSALKIQQQQERTAEERNLENVNGIIVEKAQGE